MTRHTPTTLAALTADPQNRRSHDARNLDAIAQSLKAVGAARSIVIDEDDVILAGNGVTQAARAAGLTKLRVIEASGDEVIAVRRRGLSADQKRALALYDNRTAELATWNVEQLLADQQAGLDLGAWWTDDELAALLNSNGTPKPGKTDPDAVPEVRATDIQRGDLFALGAHRLLCGDSTVAADVARVMGEERAELLVTSPPYNQRLDTFKPSGMHKEGHWVDKVGRLAYPDSMPEDKYQEQQRAALWLWAEYLTDQASAFYNHKNRYRDKVSVSPLAWLAKGPFKLRQEIVWRRPGSVTQNARMFLPSDERIYWLYKGTDFYFDDSTEIKTWSTVWDIALETNLSHAVGFPVELPTRAIRACSKSGACVLEPFVGSGTTVIACEQHDRHCRAIELDPQYAQVALDRWEAFTGQRAQKVGEAVRLTPASLTHANTNTPPPQSAPPRRGRQNARARRQSA